MFGKKENKRIFVRSWNNIYNEVNVVIKQCIYVYYFLFMYLFILIQSLVVHDLMMQCSILKFNNKISFQLVVKSTVYYYITIENIFIYWLINCIIVFGTLNVR
jgi:hypothetical protein